MKLYPLTTDDLSRAARSGAISLARSVQASGKFDYQINSATGKAVRGEYNDLRHCGSVWAMLSVAGNDPFVRRAAFRAIDYIIRKCYRPLGKIEDKATLVTKGHIKLGLNGLFMLMCRQCPEMSSYAVSVANFTRRMQKVDGDFFHKKTFPDCADTPFVSAYYTGEALFGLCRVQENHYSDALNTCLDRAFDALLKLDYGLVERSHWMQYALHARCVNLVQLHDRINPDPRLLAYKEWAKRIGGATLRHASAVELHRSAQIATRAEGLAASLYTLSWVSRQFPNEESDRTYITAAETQIVTDVNRLLRLQHPVYGVRGSEKDKIIQIDYTQHTISAFMLVAGLEKLTQF